MDSVFISSVQSGFEAERQAARGAVESLGLRAVMAETAGASPSSSRDALLGHVDGADAFILILGARYGEHGESGFSPTEDEFNHAVASGKDVLVFVQQDVEREPKQDEFVRRVRGRWEQGLYAPGFRTPQDLAFAVVRSLRELNEQRSGGSAAPAAQEEAAALAAGTNGRSYGTSGSVVRMALVPVGGAVLLDALALEDVDLPDRLAGIMRTRRLVPHSAGLTHTVSSGGLSLEGKEPSAYTNTTLVVDARGAITAESDCAAQNSHWNVIDDARVQTFITAASAAAQDTWAQIDSSGRVRQVAAAVGVPDAHMQVYATAPVGNTMTMPMNAPSKIVVPDPPSVVRRNDIGTEQTTLALVAALRRAFADAGALHTG